MQQKTHSTTSLNRGPDHKHSLENSRLIQIARNFEATPDRVWAALTEERLVAQWWGPSPFTCPVSEIDFRIGGKFFNAMESPDGIRTYSTGIFENIVDQELIVYSDHFANEIGQVISPNEAGMSGEWTDDLYVTLELAPMNDSRTTQLMLSHQGIPTEQHDACIEGWNGCLDKLQKLVERKTESFEEIREEKRH
ncbi:hypothetical protein BH10BDE1_BH10BDE1_03900 [soil metagenome]